MRILIADDTQTTHNFLHRALASEFDVEVEHAFNGVEAIERLSSHRYDLLLLDIDMPVLGGLEVLQAIRRSPEHAALPVIVLTGHNEEELVRKTIALDVTDLMLKPLDARAVRARVGSVLSKLHTATGDRGPARLMIQPLSTVLVADGSADMRTRVATALGPGVQVLHAECGMAALKQCLDVQASLAAVFIGSSLGLMDETLVARVLCEKRPDLRLVALVPAETVGDRNAEGLYDLVLSCEEEPGTLASRLAHHVRRLTVPALVQSGSLLSTTFGNAVSRAADLELGLVLEQQRGQRSVATVSDDWIVGSVTFRHESGTFALRLACAARGVRQVSARRAGTEAETVGTAEMIDTVASLASSTAELVAEALGAVGLRIATDRVTTTTARMRAIPPREADEIQELVFRSEDDIFAAFVKIAAPGHPHSQPRTDRTGRRDLPARVAAGSRG